MKTRTLITKEQKLRAWGPGQWVDEPDAAEFVSHGLNCRVIRNGKIISDDLIVGGVWCGYVEVDESMKSKFADCEVHGGITWEGPRLNLFNEEESFCIGFDCNHAFDISPSNNEEKMFALMGGEIFPKEYRDFDFAISETKYLAKQISEIMEKEKEPLQTP